MNKKAIAMSYLIGIIIFVLSFFLIYNNLIKSSTYVVSSVDDLKCRASVETSDVKDILERFFQVKKNCKTDNSKIEGEKKEEIFEEVAEKMAKCWYRYGEGEEDFLNNFGVDGNWCFLCGKYSFEEDKKEIYDYVEFIDWTKKNKVSINDDSVNYHDYMQMKYPNEEGNELEDLRTTFQELKELNLEGTQELTLYFGEQYEYAQDLRLKQINTNNNLYVVYRYDKFDKSLDEIFLSTGAGIIGGAAAGSLAIGLGTAVITGPIGAVVGVVKFVKTLNDLKKAEKILKIIEKGSEIIKSSIKFSKKHPIKAGIVASGTAGGISAGISYNDNELQYVDIMNQEQYYRLCGTEPNFK